MLTPGAIEGELEIARSQSVLQGRVAWIAVAWLALAGGTASVAIEGARWWWLGLACVAPLVVLMLGRLAEGRRVASAERATVLGSPMR